MVGLALAQSLHFLQQGLGGGNLRLGHAQDIQARPLSYRITLRAGYGPGP